jgi:tryptophan synthase beta chain
MIACIGGGSNAIVFFHPFFEKKQTSLIGVEAGGTGPENGLHAQRMTGVAIEHVHQGYRSMFLCNDDKSIMDTASISAGLDYAGIGPQLAAMGKRGRIEYTFARDHEVIEAFKFFARNEGVIAALESSHALAAAIKLTPTLPKNVNIIANVSGRGDKDLFITAPRIQGKKWEQFLSEELERVRESLKKNRSDGTSVGR